MQKDIKDRVRIVKSKTTLMQTAAKHEFADGQASFGHRRPCFLSVAAKIAVVFANSKPPKWEKQHLWL